MKLKKLNARGFSHHFAMALVVLVTAIGGTYYLVASHADSVTAQLSLSPASQSVTVGSDMVVNLDLNTNGNLISRVQSVLTYSPAYFSITNISPGVASNFTARPLASGQIQLTENTANPVIGPAIDVATITLHAIANGTTTLSLSTVCPMGNYYGSICSAAYGPSTSAPTINDLSSVTGGNYIVNNISSAPATPGNISAHAISSTQININWSASAGAVGYAVYRNGNEISTGPNTSYSDSGLTPSTRYSYYVIAYNAVGNKGQQSAPTTTISVVTQAAQTTTTAEQLSTPPARRPAQYLSLCAVGSTYYVTAGNSNCWAGGIFIENYPSNVPGTYYNAPCVSSSTSPTATRFAYISSNESCVPGTSRVPSQLAQGEQLSMPPARRPAQYLHVCTSSVSQIYVTLGSSSSGCTFGGNFVQNYPPTVLGIVQNIACGATSGSLMRYAYIQSGESCPSGTFTTI
ncbi:MAG TPA: fibronectin type III domain-containing protein [Candidatus Dormibacteraeota bacterium]|nr:fibronectin type III domain-containing protein [Candidatus Dormibacteraeota bacterium]